MCGQSIKRGSEIRRTWVDLMQHNCTHLYNTIMVQRGSWYIVSNELTEFCGFGK